MKQAEKCPRCNAKMQRLYLQGTDENHKRKWYCVGWLCSDPMCKTTLIDDIV